MICALASSARAEYIPIDRQISAQMDETDVTAASPPVRMEDFDFFRNAASGSGGTLTGRLLVPTILGTIPGSGIAVYALPASAYSGWYAKLAVSNVRGYKGTIAHLDQGVRTCCLRSVKTDGTGRFEFDDLPRGPYYFFAALVINKGPIVPKETVQRGWDGNGHGADVRTPDYTFASTYQQESFTWRWGMRFDVESLTWDAGELTPGEHFLNGDAVKR